MRIRRLAISFALFAITFARPARALEQSTRRPFYLEGTLAGIEPWFGFNFTASKGVYYHPGIEFGVHFTGRHDGLALGLRQSFAIGGSYPIGETVLRAGWDLALPFRNGRFEVTLAPFATVGMNYFLGPGPVQAGAHFSVGFDMKLFFYQGLYLLLRPVELSLGEFVDLAPVSVLERQNVFFNFDFGAGLGYAF